MRAVRITGRGGPEVLRLEEAEPPRPGAGEITVRVRASALNRADLLQARGHYPAPPGVPADIPGLEYAGEVVALGPDAAGMAIGDRVMGLVGGGAFAEQVVVHPRTALPIPPSLSFEDAAALPEAFLTAHDALVSQGGLVAGQSVLVHAAASGVGTAATQVAAALGATVLGTVRSEKKRSALAALGVQTSLVCAGEIPRFAQAVRDATGGRGADLALDLVGGPYLPETLAAMAPRGRVILVGLLAGREALIPLDRLLGQRLMLRGTVMRARALDERIAVAEAAKGPLLSLLSAGRVRPVVHAVFPFGRVAEAAALLGSNETIGKLVLTWRDDA